MRPGVVLEPFLDELEAGQAHVVERRMIGGRHAARARHLPAQRLQRLAPLLEDRQRALVGLTPDAADAAGAVVEIEVGGHVGMIGLRRVGGAVPVVLGHVGARPEQALFFAAPERHSDGAARLEAERPNRPHGLHHGGRAGGVVGGAGGVGHAVHVRPHDHDLVGQIGAGNLGNGVDAVQLRAFGVKRRLDVHFHAHGHLAIDEAHEPVVVLHGERGRRHLRGCLGVAAAAAGGEDGAAVGHLGAPREVAAARRGVGVVAAFEQHAHAFVDQELLNRERELLTGAGRVGGSGRGRRRGRRLNRRGGFGPPRAVVHAQDHRTLEHAHDPRGLHHHDLAAQLSRVGGEVGRAADLHAHHLAGDGASGGGREVARRADEHGRLRLDHRRREALDGPALAERPPFLVHVAESPLAQLRHGPVTGLRERGRAGHARTVDLR